MEVLEYDNKLSELLEFGHDDEIIDGFINRYNVTIEEAKEILDETKKWLWLASESHNDRNIGMSMDKPLLIIDEMWHNFIIYTKHYQQFCMDKFNKFVHHIPTPSWTRKKTEFALLNNSSKDIEEKKKHSFDQLSFIYDKLGAETVMKWYEEFPTKYTADYIASIKK